MQWLVSTSSRYLFVLAVVGLAACSSLAPRDSATPVVDGGVFPRNWTINGKLSLRPVDPAATPELRSQVVSFNWQQRGEELRLQLSGTLGFGRLVIENDALGARILRGDSVVSEAAGLDQLLWQQTGIELPTHFLQHWVMGLPAPAQPNSPAANPPPAVAGDTLGGFEQQGWQINYPRSERIGDYLLPRRIDAEDDRLALRIAIARWQFPPVETRDR